MERGYTIGQLAELSGASARSLRFYEEMGLLAPGRDPSSGYRRYGPEDVDRLQEILLLRRLGVAVRDIAPLLSDLAAGRRKALEGHLDALRAERKRLDGLIVTVERTLAGMKGEATMTDEEKFEGLKRELVDDLEGRYGREACGLYGDAAVEESARKVLGMEKEDYERWQGLDAEICALLENAVRSGADPAGSEGERVCGLHVADGRFTEYYDRSVPGCAAWLRDAIVAHAE